MKILGVTKAGAQFIANQFSIQPPRLYFRRYILLYSKTFPLTIGNINTSYTVYSVNENPNYRSLEDYLDPLFGTDGDSVLVTTNKDAAESLIQRLESAYDFESVRNDLEMEAVEVVEINGVYFIIAEPDYFPNDSDTSDFIEFGACCDDISVVDVIPAYREAVKRNVSPDQLYDQLSDEDENDDLTRSADHYSRLFDYNMIPRSLEIDKILSKLDPYYEQLIDALER